MVLESPTQRRPRRVFPRALGFALALLAAFLLGIAVARAIDDGPKAGGVVTSVRTLTPLPQRTPTRTVTVTVTQP